MKLNLSALIAFSIFAGMAALSFVGLKPRLTPGWSFAMGTALAFYAAFLADHAKGEWTRTGLRFGTVLRMTLMGVATFFAFGCYLVGAFLRAAEGQ